MRLLDTLSAGTAALLVAPLIGGCHLPMPDERAVLHISSRGAFTLDGQAIDPAQLKTAIAAHHPVLAGLLVEVRASPSADMQAVTAAIETLKQSQVHIAFAREDGTP